MSKWLSLLREIEQNKNGGKQPMSGLSVPNMGIYGKIRKESNLIETPSVSANVSVSVCHKAPFFDFYLNNKKNIGDKAYIATDKPDIGSIEPIHAEPSSPQVTLSFEVLVEEITRYKNVLEQTYLDPDNDEWHADGMPEKFRSQEHTYEEIKIALARFIGRVHRHEEEVDTASLAFRSARDALPDYQKYMKVLRVIAVVIQDPWKK